MLTAAQIETFRRDGYAMVPAMYDAAAVRGWHGHGLIGDEWRPLNPDSAKGITYEACPTAPGDAIFFNSFVPHRSAPNLTPHPRRVPFATYNRIADGDHRAQYYADKRRNYPPDIEREAGKKYAYRV